MYIMYHSWLCTRGSISQTICLNCNANFVFVWTPCFPVVKLLHKLSPLFSRYSLDFCLIEPEPTLSFLHSLEAAKCAFLSLSISAKPYTNFFCLENSVKPFRIYRIFCCRFLWDGSFNIGRKLGFTGSTEIGHTIMQSCASSNLKKCSLELGRWQRRL